MSNVLAELCFARLTAMMCDAAAATPCTPQPDPEKEGSSSSSSTCEPQSLLQAARAQLPTDLKEQLFSRCCDALTEPTAAAATTAAKAEALPTTTEAPGYPAERYRDVQLVNRITCQRVIPLCFALWSSLDFSDQKVRRLVEEDACDVNECDVEGFCPLHYAAIYSRVAACRLLLSCGADSDRRNRFGKTPFDLAQDSRIRSMIKLRSALFTRDEVSALQAEARLRRQHVQRAHRRQLALEFAAESAHLARVLSTRQQPATSSAAPARHFNEDL